MHNFKWVLATCKNLEKTNERIPRKRPDRQKDGQKDRHNLFYRTLPATAGGQITFQQITKCN